MARRMPEFQVKSGPKFLEWPPEAIAYAIKKIYDGENLDLLAATLNMKWGVNVTRSYLSNLKIKYLDRGLLKIEGNKIIYRGEVIGEVPDYLADMVKEAKEKHDERIDIEKRFEALEKRISDVVKKVEKVTEGRIPSNIPQRRVSPALAGEATALRVVASHVVRNTLHQTRMYLDFGRRLYERYHEMAEALGVDLETLVQMFERAWWEKIMERFASRKLEPKIIEDLLSSLLLEELLAS